MLMVMLIATTLLIVNNFLLNVNRQLVIFGTVTIDRRNV
jgi:hypothetical protein